MELGDGQFDEEALLNDPELNKELQMLLGTAETQTTTTEALTAKKVEIPVSQVAKMVGDGEEVEIDEHELPELMQELKLLSGDSGEISSLQDENLDEQPPALKPSSKSTAKSQKAPAETAQKHQKALSAPGEKTEKSRAEPKKPLLITKEKNQPKPSISPTSAPSPTKGIAECLEHQIEVCTRMASDLYKISRKEEALHFHKYKKQFILDQSLLVQTPPPTFSRILVKYGLFNFNWEVPLDALQLNVNATSGLKADFQMKIETPFADVPISTHSMKPGTIDFSQSFRIEYTKSYQRYFEKKKITIEFLQPRFLRSPLFIGKVVIPLSDLLTKSVISGSMQIMDASNRKPIGAFVELSLKLRKPFTNTLDIEIVQEPWIISNEPSFYSYLLDNDEVGIQKQTSITAKAVPATAGNTEKRKQSINMALNARQSMKTSSQGNSNTKENTSSLSDVDIDELIMKFDATQSNSNNVLELELEKLMQNPVENKEKIESIQTQMSILVIQVQSGSLSVETYVGKLEDELLETKRLCLSFKRAGRLDYAKRALDRVKTIDAEIKSAQNIPAE